MHHSNPFGCVFGVQVTDPSGLRWQLSVVAFLYFHPGCRFAFNRVM